MNLPSNIVIDGHEDLAMNALAEGRDYLTSARRVRAIELAAGFENPNGICMLGLDEWLAGRVAVVVATVCTIPRNHANPGEMSYPTIEAAHQQALAQVDLYRRWASHPNLELICSRTQFDQVLSTWSDEQSRVEGAKVGMMLAMENADPVHDPAEVEAWAELGVRMIGPAWHANRYTGDTKEGGPLTPLGRSLLSEMARCSLTLDITHMSEEATLAALANFDGPVVASHAHSRRTVDYERLLSDQVVRGIVARGGLIGVLPVNWALHPHWQRGGDKRSIMLDHVVDAIDAVCQIAGDARHVGLGTDFDGGQGAEGTPSELDTVADLQRLSTTLQRRGYSPGDVEGIMAGNWARFLRDQLPA